MSNTPSGTKTENLGFTIENRAGADVVVWKEGGCRPATSAEIAMWKALSAVQQPVVREPLTQEQVSEIADAAHRECDRLVSSDQCAPRWSAVFAYLLERAHGIKGGQHGTDT